MDQRYQRQTLFRDRQDGQERLLAATAVIVCGATGSALANLLVRAGVAAARIIDRDFIELNNLQRRSSLTRTISPPTCPKRKLRAASCRANSGSPSSRLSPTLTPATFST